MNNRIREVRKTVPGKLTQEEFGARLGVSREVITSYELGRVIPPEPTLRLIATTFKVDYVWLKTGKGSMFASQEDEVLAAVDDLMTGENKTAQALIRMMAKLDEEQWAALEQIIEVLKKEMGD